MSADTTWWPAVFSGLLGAVVGGLLTSITAVLIFKYTEKANNERQRLDRLRDAAGRFVQFVSTDFISSLDMNRRVGEVQKHFETLAGQLIPISNPTLADADFTVPSHRTAPASEQGEPITPLMEQYRMLTADLNALSANVASTQAWTAIRSELRLVAPQKILEEADKIFAISSWRQLDTTSEERRKEAAELFSRGVTVFVNSVRREMALNTFEMERDTLATIYDRVEKLYGKQSDTEGR